MTVRYGAVEIDWLGHATSRIAGRTGAVIYVDPDGRSSLERSEPRDGDLVLVTHEHHYDPDAIRQVAREDTIVVCHESIDVDDTDPASRGLAGLPATVELVADDESFVVGPLDLWTTPAYNSPDGPHVGEDGRPYHLEGKGCGYGVTIDGVTVYVPGDTDALDLHEELAVDVFLPPIGGRYTMDRREAAALAARVRPGLVLPVHYDTSPALETDVEAFVVDVATRGVPVVVDR